MKGRQSKAALSQSTSPTVVDFLLVGAQKSGTTTLYSYFCDHPQIQMANKKEVHFFNSEKYFAKEKPDYDFYHSWFDVNENSSFKNKVLKGECTPAYLYCRNSAVRIWQYNAAMKIIIILRNPIERAFSHWNMEANRGAESLSFKQALLQELQRSRDALPLQHYVYSYMDRGFYVSQIQEYWRCFGKKQVLVLKYDQLKDNPVPVLENLFSFLGVDDTVVDILAEKRKILHKASYKEKIDHDSKLLLLKYYRNEIMQLEVMLEWDCQNWLEMTELP